MYIILMNPDDNPNGYKGAICIIDDSPYYVTGEQKPTLFPTEKEAEKVIKGLQKLRSKVKFEVIPIEVYLAIVDPPWENSCKWIGEMREKFAK
jgi:hypothetical protein